MRCLALVCLLVTACAEHGSGGAGGPCNELSLGDCRTAAGCKADICPGCLCDLAFRGCVPADAVVSPCPDLGCPGAECCSAQEQCLNGATCTPPGAPFGCGPCNTQPGDCTTDSECKATSAIGICQPIQCTCTDQKMCVDGCFSDDQCSEAEQCDFATARCVARQCANDDGCPAAFICTGGTCARAPCSSDEQCDGFCVLGQCFASGHGICQLPPV